MLRSRGVRIAGTIVVIAFLAINLLNAWRKGGDFDDYLAAGGRLLHGDPLYAGSTVAYGFVGPPAQALLFTPFAWLDLHLGPQVPKVMWFGINVALLWYAIAAWMRVFKPRPLSDSRADADSMARWTVILPLVAIAAPLQSQFEHQNLNIVLLALAACAAEALIRQRDRTAGVALGIAAAIKVYPVLPLIWLALRPRHWRAVGVGIVTAIAVSVTPIVFRGLDGFLNDGRAWQTLASSGWPTRRGNQSVAAMWGRYVLGEGADGYPIVTFDQPIVFWLTIATALVLLVPLVMAWRRNPPHPFCTVEELVCVSGVAMLLSPIAWEHYWVGFFPLFVLLGLTARPPRTTRSQWWAAAVFAIGFVCFTLIARPIVGAKAAHVLRAWSLDTWAAILMCVTYATLMARRRWTARLTCEVRRMGDDALSSAGERYRGDRAG